jgi:ppGpp synthetase/RelA/SpoT-type nucleotidyltranferase
MNIPQPLISIYGDLLPILNAVEKRVTQTLAFYSRAHLLPFIARIKTIESAAEKIETGRYRSFTELDDLVALTLVVPSIRHEEAAIEHCMKVFRITDVKRKISARKPPDSFRFDATRLYGFLINPEEGISLETTSVFSIKFEIQIRTAFEHAWIVATHPLTYKTGNIDWKRLRLSAQLKASAEQLDLAVLQFEALAAAISEAPWPEIEQKRKVVSLIERLLLEEIIPKEAGPKDMSRFAENLLRLLGASKKRVDVDQSLLVLESSLREFPSDSFPMSASLLQVCMGILCKTGILTGPLQRYSCHVTEHLSLLFPDVRNLSPVFDYGRGD